MAKHGAAITAEALDDMPYGTTVVRELLRITPAVPAVFRVALEDFELQGRRIPKVRRGGVGITGTRAPRAPKHARVHALPVACGNRSWLQIGHQQGDASKRALVRSLMQR